MKLREALARFRYNKIPDHLAGEILVKNWADNLVPFVFLIAVIAIFGSLIPGFFTAGSLLDTSRQLGEFLIVVIGLTVVIIGGGIDLSVGSIFALSAFAALSVIYIGEGPVWISFIAAVGMGALFGAFNGFLIGYLRLRAFLTTLVTLIIGRSIYDILIIHYGKQIQSSQAYSDSFDWIGIGTLWGIPVSALIALLFTLIAHSYYALAYWLAYKRCRRSPSLSFQYRYSRATHSVSDLCCLWSSLWRCRLFLCGASFGCRAGLRAWSGITGIDSSSSWRQQPWRRARFNCKGLMGPSQF